MSNPVDYVELARKARSGDQESSNRLAEIARVRLHDYVLRLTLDEEVTQDIVQESILEMLKVFNKLKKPDRFWSWLYGIAYNKVRDHRRRRSRRKAAPLSAAGGLQVGTKGKADALADIVGRELKEIVLTAMQELDPRQRDVLTMRCYDEMPYSEIAQVMGCTEFGAQALFYRAKKALAKRLSRHGLGKGYLLAALVLFGKMTTSSEAAAANVSITAATIKVGAAASLAAIATTKTAIVSLATVGLIAAGSATIGPSIVRSDAKQQKAVTTDSFTVVDRPSAATEMDECWYFFPDSLDGPAMMRFARSEKPDEHSPSRVLQNQHGNYHFYEDSVRIESFRLHNGDLSVRRLPTDEQALSAFISRVEGKLGDMEYTSAAGKGLLVICKRSESTDGRIWRVDRHSNVLEEVFFQFDRPEGATVVDNRDAMRKRGWTYFRVSGQIGGQEVSGVGRIPFAFAASKEHYPWVDLKVGEGVRIVDSGAAVCAYEAGGKVVEEYEGGSFFDCMGRPWMGMHTLDTVRRAAAEQRIRFETKLNAAQGKAQVVLTGDKMKLVYGIDLERDLVERFTILADDEGDQEAKGEVRFSYLEEMTPPSHEFAAPRARSTARTGRDRLGIFGLVRLVSGNR